MIDKTDAPPGYIAKRSVKGSCDGCAFGLSNMCSSGWCDMTERHDKTDVIFVREETIDD